MLYNNSFMPPQSSRIDITGQTLDLDNLKISRSSEVTSKQYIQKSGSGGIGITNKPTEVDDKPFILDLNLIQNQEEENGDYNYCIRQKIEFNDSEGIMVRFYTETCITVGQETNTSSSWSSWEKIPDNSILKYSGSIKCNEKTDIIEGSLIVGNNGMYSSIADSSTFDIVYPILSSTSYIAKGSTDAKSFIARIHDLSIDVAGISLTSNQPVYIKGTLSSTDTTFTKDTVSPITQDTSEANFQYIYLGMAYSTTEIYLSPTHQIYDNDGSSFGIRGGSGGGGSKVDVLTEDPVSPSVGYMWITL